jgi:hypothetical protein
VTSESAAVQARRVCHGREARRVGSAKSPRPPSQHDIWRRPVCIGEAPLGITRLFGSNDLWCRDLLSQRATGHASSASTISCNSSLNCPEVGRATYPLSTSRGPQFLISMRSCSAPLCPLRYALTEARPTSGFQPRISFSLHDAHPHYVLGRNAAHGGIPVAYAASLEHLLHILHARASAKVDALTLEKRRVRHGLLSVGLKLHCLGDEHLFAPLIAALGGETRVLDQNVYQSSRAKFCLVRHCHSNALAWYRRAM